MVFTNVWGCTCRRCDMNVRHKRDAPSVLDSAQNAAVEYRAM